MAVEPMAKARYTDGNADAFQTVILTAPFRETLGLLA